MRYGPTLYHNGQHHRVCALWRGTRTKRLCIDALPSGPGCVARAHDRVPSREPPDTEEGAQGTGEINELVLQVSKGLAPPARWWCRCGGLQVAVSWWCTYTNQHQAPATGVCRTPPACTHAGKTAHKRTPWQALVLVLDWQASAHPGVRSCSCFTRSKVHTLRLCWACTYASTHPALRSCSACTHAGARGGGPAGLLAV